MIWTQSSRSSDATADRVRGCAPAASTEMAGKASAMTQSRGRTSGPARRGRPTAMWAGGRQGMRDLSELVHHSDVGSQPSTPRSPLPNAWPRPGLHPALARWAMPWTSTSRNRDRPIKTELIHHRGPWCGHDDVELATLKWVDWHSHQGLPIACHDLTPAKYERTHYSQHPARTEAGISTT